MIKKLYEKHLTPGRYPVKKICPPKKHVHSDEFIFILIKWAHGSPVLLTAHNRSHIFRLNREKAEPEKTGALIPGGSGWTGRNCPCLNWTGCSSLIRTARTSPQKTLFVTFLRFLSNFQKNTSKTVLIPKIRPIRPLIVPIFFIFCNN